MLTFMCRLGRAIWLDTRTHSPFPGRARKAVPGHIMQFGPSQGEFF